ncbi:MAG: hypothetical protein ABSE00_04570, partial [Chitinispirillaceae bacterium]
NKLSSPISSLNVSRTMPILNRGVLPEILMQHYYNFFYCNENYKSLFFNTYVLAHRIRTVRQVYSSRD